MKQRHAAAHDTTALCALAKRHNYSDLAGRPSGTVSFKGLVQAFFITTVIAFVASTTIHADVPKAEDVAACNREAQDALRPGGVRSSAQPNAKDEIRAARAREGIRSDETSQATRSSDAQLEGMDADGAKHSVYQATFRGCMRRRGF